MSADIMRLVRENLNRFLQTSPPKNAAENVFDQYEMRKPAAQNAIDALEGWNSAFPGELGLTAGTIPLFADDRIHKVLQSYGSIEGKKILEVGPLEECTPICCTSISQVGLMP